MSFLDYVTDYVEYEHTNRTILDGNVTNTSLINNKLNLVLLMLVTLHAMVTNSSYFPRLHIPINNTLLYMETSFTTVK